MLSTQAWNLIVSVASTSIAALAVAIGVWQYLEEGERNRQAAEQRNLLEFNRALWEEEFKTYRDISAAVGDLVAAVEMDDAEAYDRAEMTFRALYWGRAVFVEAESIERQMITFRRRIDQHAEGRLTKDQLKRAANILSDALENAVRLGAEAARQAPALNESTP